MQLKQIARDALLRPLQAVSGIVERRHTLPILANVLIRKTGTQIELTTSDLEIQVRTRAELGGDAVDFATTVGARKLIDILRALPSDQIVTLGATQSKLTLQGGKSRFTLQTLPSDDFPLVEEAADFGPAFSVPQKTLRALVAICGLSIVFESVVFIWSVIYVRNDLGAPVAQDGVVARDDGAAYYDEQGRPVYPEDRPRY